jgi:hypothetical protein
VPIRVHPWLISIPNSIRHRSLLQIRSATRALVRLIPALHPVMRGNRALHLELNPSEGLRASGLEPIQSGIETWSLFGNWLSAGKSRRVPLTQKAGRLEWFLVRKSDARYRVIQFPAIPANNGLDEKVQASVRSPRDLGAVPALGTLKPVRPSHAISRNFALSNSILAQPGPGDNQANKSQNHLTHTH